MTALFPETIVTARLRLELVHPDTTDPFELYEHAGTDPDIDEITEYLTWDPHRTPKDSLDFIEHIGARYDDDAEGASYAIRPRDGESGAGEFAGDAGFGVDWDRRSMELGTWLRKPFWGRGYSGERAAAMMKLAFDRLDLELVTVTSHVDNERSNRAITKYVEAHGGQREGLLRNWQVHDGEPDDFYRYSVASEEWEANRGDDAVRFEW